MFNSKGKNSVRPEKKKEKFYFKANGIGACHAAPAVCMAAAGLALSVIISGAYSGTINVFASSVVSDENAASGYTEKTSKNNKDIDFSYIPVLPYDIVERKESSAGNDSEWSDYCVEMSSERAEEKLRQSEAKETEKERLKREHLEAWNQKVVSSNQNLYLDGYSFRRGFSNIPTLAGDYVRLNTNGKPMSQLQPPASLQLDENGVPKNYSYYIDGKATAYCDGTCTATGTGLRQGVVAVDPRIIPYGTEMYITSRDGKYVYGYCRAEDTGGFIYFRNGATVDLFMHSYDDCDEWGWRDARIYVLPRSY